jgi:hypothetical protein
VDQHAREDPVIKLLVKAAAGRIAAPGREEWSIGWSAETYRRSDRAAVSTDEGPMTFDPPSLEAYEQAVELLLSERKIRDTWDAEDFWGIVADMVATIPTSVPTSSVEDIVAIRLKQLRKPGDTLIALAIANVAWEGSPLSFSNLVIGELGEQWKEAVNSVARSRPKLDGTQVEWWLNVQAGIEADSGGHEMEEPPDDNSEASGESKKVWPDPSALKRPPVVMATWVQSHHGLAVRHASERLQQVIDLALLLEPEPKIIELYPIGSANQPGLRGLKLDRGAIGAVFAGRSIGRRELAATILHKSNMSSFVRTEWYGLEPVPLHLLMGPPGRQQRINNLLEATTPFALRLRTAARWYAQARWADNVIDIVLALGIALDALVGDPSGLPLLATSERFALLEPNPQLRSVRARAFRDFFGTRSAIAHGGRSTKLTDDYLIHMASEVRWATQRMLSLNDIFSPKTHNDLRDVFDGLKWGSLQWPRDAGPASSAASSNDVHGG